ncbi:MAG: isoaspartyl peptidase/L-asparaginase [Ignavibacteria bacterium]|nr:isoaspartyl peptidase/L-asparaginase [Ignavibacteria bacterium]
MKIISKALFFVIPFLLFSSPIFLSRQESNYTIVIHGGAGYISPEISTEVKEAYKISLTRALTIGKNILENGGSSLDAVELVIRYFENDSLFNAGKGAVFTSEGTHELDASIMYGVDLSTGAVAGVKTIKNPITLARLVMEQTPHVLFAGEGADKLGKKFQVDIVDNNYFDINRRYQQWKMKQQEKVKGTVGVVAWDKDGNIAAGTSTGGLTNKWPGRVGDSPLINAGTYADNNTCGVSATGQGELFIRYTVAYNISALMKFKNYSLQEAADEMIFNVLPEGSGGIIAVGKDGNYVLVFNTSSMLRGVANSNGVFELKIWK